MTYTTTLETIIDNISIECSDEHVLEINLHTRAKHHKALNALSKDAYRQIHAYFREPNFQFDLPLIAAKTSFQNKIRKVLLNIPLGKTLTYGDIAKQLNSSPRAVGQACRCNPLPIVVPCHRVVAKTHVGGFAGALQGRKLASKLALLHYERQQ